MYNYRKLFISCMIVIGVNTFFITGCKPGGFRTLYADGWLKRPVIVTVIDESTSKAIKGADVKIMEPESLRTLFENPKIEKKYEQITDANGIAELLIWFGFSSETKFGNEKGSYTLSRSGLFQVTAEGYKPFDSTLSLLSDRISRSVKDKSPVRVFVKLTPSDETSP